MSIKNIFSILIFNIIFDIIFTQLSKRKPQLFSIFDKIPKKWKGKYIYKWLALLPLLVISAIVAVFLELNYIASGIMVGFSLSLCDIAFKAPTKSSDRH